MELRVVNNFRRSRCWWDYTTLDRGLIEMLGMASGIFIVPILTTWGGVDIRAAIPTSLVTVIACSCGSAASFLDGGLTNARPAIVLETATTLGAVTGFLLVGAVPITLLGSSSERRSS